MFTAVVWRPSPNEKNSQGKQSGSEGGHLCFAHLARITRCKLLQPLRHRCQFMERTTVKFVLRKSFDLNYLRKMCGTWAVKTNFAACRSHPGKFQCIIKSTIRAAWTTLARSAAVIAPRAMMSSRLRRVWFIR